MNNDINIEAAIDGAIPRLFGAVNAGVPIANSPAQARELIAHENEAAARAARTDAWLAKAREAAAVTNRCERADERRYGKPGPGRPGRAVFDRMDGLMTPSAKAEMWARIELQEIDQDGDASRLATVLERIATGLRGEMPNDVEINARRGCCGATLIQRETEDGTDYECPLCGKDVLP